MGKLVRSVMAINLAILVLQFCVLAFQVSRWNEIVGAIFSIVVSVVGYMPTSIGEHRERWFVGFYASLMLADLAFQLVNMILLICFQWVVIQFCINQNYSIDISEYGGVACTDWWHFGYGEINYRDRALITTIILAAVVLLRLVQVVLSCASLRRRHSVPMFFVGRDFAPDQLDTKKLHAGRRSDIVTIA